MKSETHIKIKESRRKYFQEVINQRTEENVKPLKKSCVRMNAEPQPEPEPQLDLERVLREMIENLPSVSMPRIMDRQKVQLARDHMRRQWGRATGAIAGQKNRLARAVDQRTEKVIDRFYSYMLVFFDSGPLYTGVS